MGSGSRALIDLQMVRANAAGIARRTGVDVLAVVKADAYGVGARRVAACIASVVDGFCVFDPKEAVRAGLESLGLPVIALGPARWSTAAAYLRRGVRPAVADAAAARALRAARPVASVDTGMGRFACPPAEVGRLLAAGGIDEAFTHAVTLEQVERFEAAVGGLVDRRHAAGTTLLENPAAWMDAVRPGLALYRGAVRVTTRLVEVHRGGRSVGYSGANIDRYGVALAGYSNGLRPGPCVINGGPRRIVEVGMQSSFVEVEPDDAPGDDVVLLGPELPPADLAAVWRCTPHHALFVLTRNARRTYVGG